MARIIVASIVRNEADRYLPSALEAWSSFADEIVAIDDDSDDDTPNLLADAGAQLRRASLLGLEGPAWGREAPYRRTLFNFALDAADDSDIILWLDADMTPARSPAEIFSEGGDVFLFNLYDLFQLDPPAYRHEPPYWVAARGWRPWALRAGYAKTLSTDGWDRGIHSGHIPGYNRLTAVEVFMPPSFGLLHYGYATSADRIRAADRYATVADDLTEQERAHASTILDDSPQLVELPYEPDWELRRAKAHF